MSTEKITGSDIKRLMPEGLEWPEINGKKVNFSECYEPYGALEAISFYNNGYCEVMSHDGIVFPAKCLKEIDSWDKWKEDLNKDPSYYCELREVKNVVGSAQKAMHNDLQRRAIKLAKED